jgi:hypothetical protein
MSIKAVMVVVLALVAGVAFWQTRPGASAPATFESAMSCQQSAPGFSVRENPEAEGARQLFVTTPAGRSQRDGKVTITYEASATVVFFGSEEDAERWTGALDDLAAATGGADSELIGTTFVDWNVEAPESDRETVRGCVGG